MRLPIEIAGAEHEMRLAAGLLGDSAAVATAIVEGLARRGRPAPDSVFLLVDAAIESTHAATLREALAAAGFPTRQAMVEATETNKCLSTLHGVARQMVESGIDRHGLVIGVGGGIIGDLAGFVAATYLRGVPCALVPTTLLAMVDAAIGGKTGVNLELSDGTLGKNLIGTFTQPVAILADPRTLSTLPRRVLRCGFAECIKHAFVADAELLGTIESSSERLLDGDLGAMTTLVARSAAIKIEVVVSDERERGARAHLNLGHTFGHAIESMPALGLMHGEAVSIGLAAAAHVAVAMDRLSPAALDRLESLLTRLELPTRLPADGRAGFTVDEAMARMGFDKKNRGGKLHLIVPDGIGRVGIVVDPPQRIVRAAWAHVGADAGGSGGGDGTAA